MVPDLRSDADPRYTRRMWWMVAASLAAEPPEAGAAATVGAGSDLLFAHAGLAQRRGSWTLGFHGGVKLVGDLTPGHPVLLPLTRTMWVESDADAVVAPVVGGDVAVGSRWVQARLGLGYAPLALVDAFAQAWTAPDEQGVAGVALILAPLLTVVGLEADLGLALTAPKLPFAVHAGVTAQPYRGIDPDASTMLGPYVAVEVSGAEPSPDAVAPGRRKRGALAP
jgi:hypothetical protein